MSGPVPSLLLGLNRNQAAWITIDGDSAIAYDFWKPFRLHWQELHEKQEATPEWLDDWIRRIPHGLCDCGSSFRAILSQYPPRYNDWFAWTVDVHNAVNTKLGKPLMTLEQARELWKQ